MIVQGPVDYDLTITEIGTFSVSINSGRAYVNSITEPRGRREAEFHVSADALTLAELIAGVPHKLGRFRGPARVSGRKRRTKPLKAIRGAGISLAEAARAGARLEPGLVFRTFPYVIHPRGRATRASRSPSRSSATRRRPGTSWSATAAGCASSPPRPRPASTPR